MKKANAFIMLSCTLLVLSTSSSAERAPVALVSASVEQLSEAMGHYGRARALLIEAVRQFDLGYKKVDPSVIIEVNEWRQDLLDRAEDLERVLDPQPRASKGGIQYSPDTRLLHEAKK